MEQGESAEQNSAGDSTGLWDDLSHANSVIECRAAPSGAERHVVDEHRQIAQVAQRRSPEVRFIQPESSVDGGVELFGADCSTWSWRNTRISASVNPAPICQSPSGVPRKVGDVVDYVQRPIANAPDAA